MKGLKLVRRRRGKAELPGFSANAVARKTKKTLLAAATCRKTVTYGTLMKEFGLSRGRALSRTIGEADRIEHEAGAPGFAALIVRKDTGFPGGGYFCDYELPVRLRRPKSRSGDPRLSKAEKNHIKAQQERIWRHYSGARQG